MVYTLFVILIVIAALLMIGIVLIQESKGGGLASNFSSSNQIMGVRKTTDVIEKTTWALAAAMVVFSVICAYVAPTASTEQSVLEKAATETMTTNPVNTQGFGAGEQTAPAEATPEAAPEAAAPAEEPKAE
jgi:preprotein translocase subunit SecG